MFKLRVNTRRWSILARLRWWLDFNGRREVKVYLDEVERRVSFAIPAAAIAGMTRDLVCYGRAEYRIGG